MGFICLGEGVGGCWSLSLTSSNDFLKLKWLQQFFWMFPHLTSWPPLPPSPAAPTQCSLCPPHSPPPLHPLPQSCWRSGSLPALPWRILTLSVNINVSTQGVCKHLVNIFKFCEFYLSDIPGGQSLPSLQILIVTRTPHTASGAGVATTSHIVNNRI